MHVHLFRQFLSKLAHLWTNICKHLLRTKTCNLFHRKKQCTSIFFIKYKCALFFNNWTLLKMISNYFLDFYCDQTLFFIRFSFWKLIFHNLICEYLKSYLISDCYGFYLCFTHKFIFYFFRVVFLKDKNSLICLCV